MIEKLYNKSTKKLGITWYKAFYAIALISALLLFDWDKTKQKDKKSSNVYFEQPFWDNVLSDINQSNDLVCWLSSIEIIADSLLKLGDYKKAIDLLLQEKDSLLQHNVVWCEKDFWNIYSSLWQSYLALEKYDIGFGYYEEAYQIAEKLWDNNKKILNLNDIASWYISLQNDEKAFFYLDKAYNILDSIDNYSLDLSYTAYLIYTNLSNYYVRQKNYNKAKFFFEKSKNLVFSDLGFWEETKVVVLSCEADFLIADKKYKEVIVIYEEALVLAEKIGHLEYQEWLLNAIESLYKDKFNDYEKAYEYSKKIAEVRNKRISVESENAIKDSEIKYQTKQIEYEKLEKTKELEIQQQKTKTARTVWWLAVALAAVLWWAGMILRRKNKQLNEKNQIITEKNDEITQKNSELEQAYEEVRATNEQLEEKNQLITEKNDELQDANQEITKQKTIIEKQHHDTLSSINYAADIQKHILSTDNYLSQHFPKSFVYRNPKDIVSGDFYLASEASNGQKVLIASDCTWHGVPAALLTVLGKIALQEWIKQSSTPWELLNYIHKFFKDQNRTHEETQSLSMWYVTSNALDIATIYFDPETKVLRASTSSKPIVILRWNEIIRLSPSIRAEIWSLVSRKGFTWYETMEYQLQEGDNIFLFSDGIVDQFDGIRDKKFGMKKLSELLKQLVTMPIEQRTWYLYKFFEKYRTKEDGSLCIQTDDMILLWFTV